MRLSIIAIAAALTLAAGCKKHEHAGTAASGASSKEHAGKEHAGKEHAGKEHAGTAATSPAASPAATPRTYNAAEIKAAMTEHIKTQTANGGVLAIKDEKTGEDLKLEFVLIHDPVRVVEGKGYFACSDFKPKGDKAGKLYDLDFWLKPDASGKLAVYDTKIHKHPEQGADKKWTKKERYTFINDNPVEVK